MQSLFTTKEAADFLNVSEPFLERDRWSGKLGIPFIKVGDRAIRYDPNALLDYLKARTRHSTSEKPVA